jgi:nucleotide-binding universal stress UspA family protein
MKRLLVAVDATDPAATREAIAEAARICAREPIDDVHLLSVQSAVNGHVAMFFDRQELLDLQQSAGEEELAPARALLLGQGVRCTSSVRVGRRAETIAAVARERGCDRVVLGRDGASAGLAGKVLGSLSQQVRQLLQGGRECRVIGA